jgi:hypothetical protein
MPDVFTRAKRSQVMSRIRSRGNRDTELALMKLFRRHGITGWRRHREVRGQRSEVASRGNPSQLEIRHSPFPGAARLCVPKTTARCLRGRLFLARLSEALPDPGQLPRLLAEKAGRQPGPRPVGHSHAPSDGLARDAPLGTRPRPAARAPSAGPVAEDVRGAKSPSSPCRTARPACLQLSEARKIKVQRAT